MAIFLNKGFISRYVNLPADNFRTGEQLPREDKTKLAPGL